MPGKLIICTGLPGSGKTTWAKEEVQKAKLAAFGAVMGLDQIPPVPIVRVNKDDIRAELSATGWQWSPENERDVIAIRDDRIAAALGLGQTVISDDTNFGKHRKALAAIAAGCGATIETKSFLDVPIEECVRRDAQRTGKAQVGRGVIERMAAQYGLLKKEAPSNQTRFAPYTRPENAMPAVICDLDGTLSLLNGRNPYDASNADQDEVNRAVRWAITACFNKFAQIIYLSGRKEQYRPQTEAFLQKNFCPPGPLHMRADDDNRTDWIIKGELFDQHVRGKYDVLFVLDDRNQVVEFWRGLGLSCFQVAEGNF